MDYYTYLIIIISLTIFIIFFGGHNNQPLIEYNSNYFNNLKSITIFENKINHIMKNNLLFVNKNFINVNDFLNTNNILIPNFVNCFIIKIKSFTLFNIYNLIDKTECKTHIMIIFNHNLYNNLELMINHKVNSGYFYNLTKQISIVKINHIYNNSESDIKITCFIFKKPYWHN